MLEERICDLCKLEIEDEAHFLFRCCKFNDLRLSFISSINCNDVRNLSIDLLWKDENLLKSIKFIVELYNERKNIIYANM